MAIRRVPQSKAEKMYAQAQKAKKAKAAKMALGTPKGKTAGMAARKRLMNKIDSTAEKTIKEATKSPIRGRSRSEKSKRNIRSQYRT